MRGTLVVLLLVVTPFPVPALELEWAGQLGNLPFPSGPNGELPAPSDAAKLLALGPADTVYIVGEFESQADVDMGPDSFVLHAPTEFGRWWFVTKTTGDGEFLWARQFDLTGFQAVSDIVVDDSGQLTLVGWYEGTVDFDPGPGTFELSAFERSPFVLRLDADGDFVWALQFLATESSRAVGLEIDPSGDLYVSGRFAGLADFDPGPGTAERLSAGDRDAFVVRLDAQGGLIWVRTFGGPGFDAAENLQLDDAGTLWITGRFSGTVDLDPGLAVVEKTSAGSSDVFVSRLNRGGNLLSVLKYGGVQGETAEAFAVDAAGNLFVAGAFWGLVDFDPGAGAMWLNAGVTGLDSYVLKVLPDGNGAWVAHLAAGQSALGMDLAIDSESNVYTTGGFFPPGDFDPSPGELIFDPGGQSAYVWKLDTDGNLVWAFFYGAISIYAESLDLDSSGNLYVAGAFNGWGDFDPGPASDWVVSVYVDGYVAKFRQSEAADWPGAVPDGTEIGESPLLLGLETDGEVRLEWDTACNAEDHIVVVGDLGTLFQTGQYDHGAYLCTTGGASTATIPATGESLYFLVAPNDGTVEGSYGVDSDGGLRPPDPWPCYPRGVGTCVN